MLYMYECLDLTLVIKDLEIVAGWAGAACKMGDGLCQPVHQIP